MAIVKTGTFTTILGGATQNLNLGFVPSMIEMWNQTATAAATGSTLISAKWFNTMVNGSAYQTVLNAGSTAVDIVYDATDGFTPLNPYPPLGQEFVPSNMTLNTNIALNTTANTGITQAAQAVITTAGNNPITAADVGVTTVTFHGIQGMTQINGLSGVVSKYVSSTVFWVNINTTSFSQYATQTGTPIANVITGEPPSTTSGFQIFNTPLVNTSFIGLKLGTDLMVTTADVWQYIAFLDASFTSD